MLFIIYVAKVGGGGVCVVCGGCCSCGGFGGGGGGSGDDDDDDEKSRIKLRYTCKNTQSHDYNRNLVSGNLIRR